MDDLATYLINLDTSTDRLAFATKQLDRAGIEFERIAAFDARARDPNSIPEYDANKAREFYGHEMTRGEIGCYISHLMAMKKFVQTDARYCLVLEDDVDIPPNGAAILNETIQWLEGLPRWQVVNLSHSAPKLYVRKDQLENFAIDRALYFPLLCTAMLWSREGAEAFVKANASVYCPIDQYVRYWSCQKGLGFALSPPPFEPREEVESDIDAADLGSPSRNDIELADNFAFKKFKRQFRVYGYALLHLILEKTHLSGLKKSARD